MLVSLGKIQLTLLSASLSSTVDPVLVPPTLLGSFLSSKESGGYGVVSAFMDFLWAKRTCFGRMVLKPLSNAEDNGYHHSTIKGIVRFTNFSLQDFDSINRSFACEMPAAPSQRILPCSYSNRHKSLLIGLYCGCFVRLPMSWG